MKPTGTIQLSELKLNPSNPRFIKDDKFASLCKSLKDFPGMMELRPIITDKHNVILGGNMRYRALMELQYKEIPRSWVKQVGDLSKQQVREFIIKDNLAFGEWDFDLLANNYTITELIDMGMDESLLDVNLWNPEITDEELDAVPEPQKDPISKLGDIFLIDGKHRVMCGDSTIKADVGALMAGKRADMVFTDPPYNVDYEGKTKDKLKIANDKKKDDVFRGFLFLAFSAIADILKSGGAIYVCHADSEGYNFRGAFLDAGFLLKQCLIWNKNSLVMGRQDYHWKHEPILYGWREGGSHCFYGDRKQTTVWDLDRPNRNAEHPTKKPVELIVKAITNSSKSEDIIEDSFLGSGSTLIASQQTNRICYGMELDPIYIDVILRRYKNLYPEAKFECLNRKFNFNKLFEKI